ncbi:MAG: hypothetical protein J6L71_02955 [Clostridia bacterium]|nr:hypothetical protein [Clostridia bacterium]
MNKVFPPMCSKPEKIQIFSIIPCWILFFVLIPTNMPLIGFGLWEQAELSVWLEIGYHVINGITMFLLIRSYLMEEWFMVTTDARYYLKHVALTVGLIALVEAALFGTLYLCGFNIDLMLESLPAVEMFVSHTPLFTVLLQPVFGTIVMSVFVPVSICVFFYCLGFAPVCNYKPWLAYVCIAAITLIPPIINIIWRGEVVFSLCGYLVQLPIHLLACWSYQKTDNVWTPIATVALTNLLTCIALLFLSAL